jgi:hemin uptake protein HemP
MKWHVDLNNENDYCSLMQSKTHADAKAPESAPGRVSSQSLLGTHKELVIVHNGREYRLRLTQNGKLILTA